MELEAEVDLNHHASGKKPPKGVLNWVAAPGPGKEPEKAEVGGGLKGLGGRVPGGGGKQEGQTLFDPGIGGLG